MQLFVFCFLFLCTLCLGNSELENVKVERNIDIASQLVKIIVKVTLANTGKVPVSSFLYALDPETKPHLSYFGASVLQEDVYLKTEEVSPKESKDKDLIRIHLKTPLSAGKIVTIKIDTMLTHYLQPYPSSITQSEKQLVLYYGNHYYYSPYVTRSQNLVITLPSNSVESYTKLKPVSQNENLITYGPFENVSPYSISKVSVHCENNNPFLTVRNLKRSIEVSHWGVISIEEDVDVVHTGAQLKGAFSRYEFQRDQSGIASVKSFKTVLPASASDVYYRDEIGNISTSHLRMLEDSTEVELRPRFPLFGGWKTHYLLGYYVPTYEYLYNTDDQFVLKMRFVDHIFDDSIIDESLVKVVLPEGSKNIHVKMPYSSKRLPDELHFTYLDTVGRPVVVIQKNNLVEQHIQDFEVHYEYQKVLMLQEPLLVVAALYALFIIVIIYVRLDFSITQDPSKESKLRVVGIMETIHNHCDNRTQIYSKFEEALSKFKLSKDSNAHQTITKKLNAEHKMETQLVADLLAKLKNEGSEMAEKVGELQRLDKALKEQLQQQGSLVERLVATKMNKQQYLDADGQIVRKKTDLLEKINAVLCSL